MGKDFLRFRFGVDRPERKELVPDYVLKKFSETSHDICEKIEESISMIEEKL